MRLLKFTPALLVAATAFGQSTNTQVNGIILTNGLTSLTDTSGLYNSANINYGISYLTDNDITTFNLNIGKRGRSIQGTFDGSASSYSTGVYLISYAEEGSLANGGFDIQLLLSSGLTNSISYTRRKLHNRCSVINRG
jgi:hypothetical protein